MSNATTQTTADELPRPASTATEGIDLAHTSVRDLVRLLTDVEDALRSTPFLIARGGLMVVNPAIAPLLSRQRVVVAQLRARRLSWRAGTGLPRTASAAWPRPPWT
ncbi:MAG TPA: hypothetical protein VH915_10505 [Pedococcus sp.]|jgi:hypothetical protein